MLSYEYIVSFNFFDFIYHLEKCYYRWLTITYNTKNLLKIHNSIYTAEFVAFVNVAI